MKRKYTKKEVILNLSVIDKQRFDDILKIATTIYPPKLTPFKLLRQYENSNT